MSRRPYQDVRESACHRFAMDIYEMYVTAERDGYLTLPHIHPQCLDQKRPLIRRLFDDLGGWFSGTVPGTSFDADQRWRGAGLAGLKL